MQYSEEQERQIDTFLRLQIGKEHSSLSTSDKIAHLYRKDRKYWILMGLNIVAITFFGYLFFAGITELSSWVFYVITGVFVLNIAFFSYQKRRIKETISYLNASV